MSGADADQLDALAARAVAAAQRLDASRSAVGRRVHSAPWRGRSADAFRSRWGSEYARSLQVSAGFLREAAGELRRNAAQQRAASGAGGGVPGAGTGAAWSAAGRSTGGMTRQDLEATFARNREIARRLGLQNVDDRQILMIDNTGGRFRIIEVKGNLLEADDVIIQVPGISTDEDDYRKGIHSHAQELYDAANPDASSPRVAVISFADYTIPPGPSFDPRLAEAADGAGADSGVRPLQGLVGDLRRMGFDRDRISVVAHSYGSVVTGHAMQQGPGLDVGRVVAIGSPGMGAGSRAELGSPWVDLWAGTAPVHDAGKGLLGNAAGRVGGGILGSVLGPIGTVIGAEVGGHFGGRVASGQDGVSAIGDLPGNPHGTDPTNDGFGANRLPVPGAKGHEYFKSDESVRNITDAALGRDPRGARGGGGGW